MTQLSDEQIRAAWASFSASREYGGWPDQYLEEVRWAAAASDAELGSIEGQRRLWSANKAIGIGNGELIDTRKLHDDPALVAALLALRTRAWASETNERALALQHAYDEIFAMVEERQLRARPAAKIARILAVLVPWHTTTLINTAANARVRALLLAPGAPPGHQAGWVAMREVLRRVLGSEDLEDLGLSVRRSIFCWWLSEHGGEIGEAKPTSSPSLTPADVEQRKLAKKLNLDVEQQYKGIPQFPGWSSCFREVLRLVGGRVARADLSIELRGAFPEAAESVLNSAIARMIGLGMLVDADGMIARTALGEVIVKDQSNDSLVELLLERVYGLAQILRVLARSGAERLALEPLVAAIQVEYPRWKTSWQPRLLLSWCEDLGLVESEGKDWVLTGYGKAWHERLPEHISRLRDEPRAVAVRPPGRRTFPSLEAIRDVLTREALVLDPLDLDYLHRAWRSHERKHFVLLAGLSGTGKTKLALAYARAVCELLELDGDEHVALIPVAPDWRDPSSLLGYYNSLGDIPTFQPGPGLAVLLHAAEQPELPHFMLLDEMNLARPELYFAPLLSAMETGDSIELYGGTRRVEQVPPRVAWSPQLHIAGTVNMDETTHAFSDKVLDRAFMLEFWRVDLAAFFATMSRPRQSDVENVLVELHGVLEPSRRHFGYRVADEILAFMAEVPIEQRVALLDRVILGKVLPRLRGGNESEALELLAKLRLACEWHGLVGCVAKVEQMERRVRATGLLSFA